MNSIGTNRILPQFELNGIHRQIRDDLKAAIDRVIDAGSFILDEEVAAFEREFAAYLGAHYVIGVGSGTDAISLILRALNIGQGDGVIAPAHTAGATISAILQAGANPLLADIDSRYYTLDPEKLPILINGRTKAIVAVHLYGQMAPMDSLLSFAHTHGLHLIEDCAQAHGAKWHGRDGDKPSFAGTMGTAGAFSFYPTKNLGALGDAGCVVTRDPQLAERVRTLRQYGWRNRFVSDEPGTNSRLDELQAAILRTKLPSLHEWNAHRQRIAAIYDQGLANSKVRTPGASPTCEHVYHQYVISSPRRDELKEFLRRCGIQTAIHYPVPIHRQPAFTQYGNGHTYKAADCLAREILSLPIYPWLDEEDASRVITAIQMFPHHS